MCCLQGRSTLKCCKLLAVAFFFLLIQFRSCSAGGNPCSSLAEVGECSFYECLDEALGGCGSHAYPVGFGYKYCSKFLHHKELFDDEGKIWVDEVRHCLMSVIVSHIDIHNQTSSSPSPTSSLTCADISKVAFDSHPTCYVDGGICHIISEDCFNFMTVLSLLDMGDLLTSTHVGFFITFKQTWGVFISCPWTITSDFIICPLRTLYNEWIAS